MLRRLKAANRQHDFLIWLPDAVAPATDLEVLIAIGKAGAGEMEGQTRLGLLQDGGNCQPIQSVHLPLLP
jgi:hypothetical protein